MLARTLDPASINAAANHPDVRPWLGLLNLGPLDLTALVTDPANVTLAGEHGGFLCHRIGEGLFEIHSIFSPGGRGRLRPETRAGLRFLFTQTDAVRVVTQVPDCNPRAAALALKTGFEQVLHRPSAWDAPDGTRCGVSYQAVTLDRWAEVSTEVLVTGGALANAVALETDDAALRTLGAAAELATGSPIKAVRFLETRALAFQPGDPAALTFVSLTPPTAILNGRHVHFLNGSFEVI